ncbi:MAG: response regulator transcription factor [Burkholderiaceae bacterium]
MQYTCLIVANAGATGDGFESEFPDYGFKPWRAGSLRRASALLRAWRFDAALLDGDDFGPRQIEMLRGLRRESRAPLLLLTRAHDEASELVALDSGATEIVRKPASARLVTAKLRRLLEIGSTPPDEPPEVTLGPLSMNAREGTASVGQQPLRLTTHQFDLLYLLARCPGQFVHREAIACALRSSAAAVGRSADVHIYRIRRKLRELQVRGLTLDTVHGRGYCLSMGSASALDPGAWEDSPDDEFVK